MSFLLALTEFFKDNTGQLSSVRLLFVLWGIAILSLWIWLSITNRAMEAISDDAIKVFAIVTTGKVIQSFSENSTTKV